MRSSWLSPGSCRVVRWSMPVVVKHVAPFPDGVSSAPVGSGSRPDATQILFVLVVVDRLGAVAQASCLRPGTGVL
jgi:hypothetical protein